MGLKNINYKLAQNYRGLSKNLSVHPIPCINKSWIEQYPFRMSSPRVQQDACSSSPSFLSQIPNPNQKNRKQKTCKPSPRNLVLLSTQSPSSVQLPYPLTVFFQSFSQLLSSPHRLHLNFYESTLLLLRGFSFVIFLEKAPLANFVRRLPFHLPLTLKIGFNCLKDQEGSYRTQATIPSQ